MKKFKKILLIMILIPLSVFLVSCKKGSRDPEKPGGGNKDPNQNENVVSESFSISYDFNLPEKYEFLLSDYVVSNNPINTNVNVAGISDVNLLPHFEGWFDGEGNKVGWYDENEHIVKGSVTSDVPTTISLKAEWDEESIEKYYYTSGLVFEVSANEAKVTNFSNTAKTVVIPRFYTVSIAEETYDYAVTSIDNSVFENLNLEKVIVNTHKLSIGSSAFKNTKLQNFDFSIVNAIGNSAFENTKFSSIEFSNLITVIGEKAFASCTSLTNIDFNDSVVNISKSAFSGCDKLKTIDKAKNITAIQREAFSGCVGLINTNFLSENKRINLIGYNAFFNCVNITDVFIPETVTTLNQPFNGCERLQSITLSRVYDDLSSERDVFSEHFGDSAMLAKSIELVGNAETKLCSYYFEKMTNLETFLMESSSIQIIENSTFRGCVNLENVTFPKTINLDKFTYNAMSDTKFLTARTEPWIYDNSVVAVIIYVPENIVPEYVIPDNVTRINDSAFEGRKTLEKITIPASVEYIGKEAFSGCESLKTVIFEQNNKIMSLENYVFSNCNNLSNLDLTKLLALETIGVGSLQNVAVETMIIPSTVQLIDFAAFASAKIKQFSISGSSDKFLVEDGVLYEDISSLRDGSELKLLAYPRMREESLFILPEKVTLIGARAFSGIGNLDYIYAYQESVEWESTKIANGETVYNSFENTIGIKLFREKSTFVVNEYNVDVHGLIYDGCSYNYDKQEIEFDDDFKPSSRYGYLKIMESNDTFSILMFEFDLSAEEPTIVAGSLKKLEKVLTK